VNSAAFGLTRMRNGRKLAARPIIRIVTQNQGVLQPRSTLPHEGPVQQPEDSGTNHNCQQYGVTRNGQLQHGQQQHGDGQEFYDLRHRWKPFFVIDSDAKDETWVY
jgi:hypothetical protein